MVIQIKHYQIMKFVFNVPQDRYLLFLWYFNGYSIMPVRIDFTSSIILLSLKFQFPLMDADTALWDRKWAPSFKWQSYLHFFTWILVLFGTKFQYSHKRRQDDEGKQSSKADIRQLVTFSVPQCATAYRQTWNSWCLYWDISLGMPLEIADIPLYHLIIE